MEKATILKNLFAMQAAQSARPGLCVLPYFTGITQPEHHCSICGLALVAPLSNERRALVCPVCATGIINREGLSEVFADKSTLEKLAGIISRSFVHV